MAGTWCNTTLHSIELSLARLGSATALPPLRLSRVPRRGPSQRLDWTGGETVEAWARCAERRAELLRASRVRRATEQLRARRAGPAAGPSGGCASWTGAHGAEGAQGARVHGAALSRGAIATPSRHCTNFLRLKYNLFLSRADYIWWQESSAYCCWIGGVIWDVFIET